MIATHDLRQKNENQPYPLKRREKDLRQRLTMRSDFSAGKDQEKKRVKSASLPKEGKVMEGLQFFHRWWDLLFDERQGKRWVTGKICLSFEILGLRGPRVDRRDLVGNSRVRIDCRIKLPFRCHPRACPENLRRQIM